MVVYTFTENDGLVWEGTENGWESMHRAMKVLGNVMRNLVGLGVSLDFAVEQIMVILKLLLWVGRER